MKPTLLLLAAGMGSRYGGLKQLDPVGPNGETLMDYSVYDALQAGFGKVVFVIRRDIEADFKRIIGSKYARQIAVDYAFQSLDDLPEGFTAPEGRTKPWGTAQAVYAARTVLHEDFAVINADDFYGRDGFVKLAKFLAQGGDNEYAMCGFKLQNTLSENGSVSRGVCTIDHNQWLQAVVEHTKIERQNGQIVSILPEQAPQVLNPDTVVSMNMWGFKMSFFDHLEQQFAQFLQAHGNEQKSEFYLPFAVAGLIADKLAKVRVGISNDAWFGVTYQADKPVVVARLADLIRRGVYPQKLWK